MHKIPTFSLVGILCVSMLIALSGCGSATHDFSTRQKDSSETGVSIETLQIALTIEAGDTLNDLQRRGLSENTPGVRSVPYNKIPGEVLGEELSKNYKELLRENTLNCIENGRKNNGGHCFALVIKRETENLVNKAGFAWRLLDTYSNFVGERHESEVTLIIFNGEVVDTYKEPLTRIPIKKKKSDFLKPLKKILPFGFFF